MSRVIRSLTTLAVLVAALACSSTTAPQSNEGTYTMVALNGFALPATVSGIDYAGTYQWRVVAGTLILRADGSYTETLNIRSYHAGVLESDYQTVEQGTYVVSRMAITFNSNAAYSYTGSVANGNLSYNTSSGQWLAQYRRIS